MIGISACVGSSLLSSVEEAQAEADKVSQQEDNACSAVSRARLDLLFETAARHISYCMVLKAGKAYTK